MHPSNPMPCPHLQPLLTMADRTGAVRTYEGRAWTNSAGQWVYYNGRFDRNRIEAILELPPFVRWHEHFGTHDGTEAGFFCERCETGVMGLHPKDLRPAPSIPP